MLVLLWGHVVAAVLIDYLLVVVPRFSYNRHMHEHARRSTEDRFWAKVEKTSDCWIWKGAKHGRGYGNFFASGYVLAHRFSYELARGPIPPGLTIDHLCRNRLCVNPDHLEAVTMRVNLLRGVGPSAVAARKTHCPRGHEYAGLNIYWTKDGRRKCRTCVVGLYAETRRRKRLTAPEAKSGLEAG